MIIANQWYSKFFIVVLVALVICACKNQNSSKNTRTVHPNICIILSDDMGFGDSECYNENSLVPTPNINRLAKEEVMFTDAHSSAAVYTPSRYGLLTGRYCWRTELKSGVLSPYGKPLIEKDRITLPNFLKEKGYATACIGKWHLGFNWGEADEFSDKKVVETRPEGSYDVSRPISGGRSSCAFCGMIARENTQGKKMQSNA